MAADLLNCLHCGRRIGLDRGVWLDGSAVGRAWCGRDAMAPGATRHEPNRQWLRGSTVRLIMPMTYRGELAHEQGPGTRRRPDVAVGTLGRINTRNTHNGRVDTVGVHFAGADGGWVIDTSCCEMWTLAGAPVDEVEAWLDA